MFLAECCPQRKVHLLVRNQLGPSMSEYLVGRIRAAKNIILHEGVVIDSVHGNEHLESITLRVSYPDITKKQDVKKTIPVSSIFVFIGADPGCSWLPKNLARDSLGYIMTGVDVLQSGNWSLKDREPCPLETSIPGILAAGDIRKGSTKRVGFAVGDGSMAITCVHKLVNIKS